MSLAGLLATCLRVLRQCVAEFTLLFARLVRFPLRARPFTTCFTYCTSPGFLLESSEAIGEKSARKFRPSSACRFAPEMGWSIVLLAIESRPLCVDKPVSLELEISLLRANMRLWKLLGLAL